MQRQELCQHFLLFAALDHLVHKPLFKQELCALESRRELLAHGLLDDTRPREPNQSVGLGQYDVPFHCKAGRNTSGRRVGQHDNVQVSRVAVALDRAAGLRHLHQGKRPLLHARTSGNRVADHRQRVLRGVFNQAGDFLSHHRAHASHHKIGFHDKQAAFHAVDARRTADNALFLRALQIRVFELAVVIGEPDQVARTHVGVVLLKRILVRNHADPLPRVHAEVVAALWVDVEIFVQLTGEQHRFALRAGDAQLAWNIRRRGLGIFVIRFQVVFRLFK